VQPRSGPGTVDNLEYSSLVDTVASEESPCGTVKQARADMSTNAEQSLVGTIGRVTVPIPAGGAGEVLLPVRGGTEAFAAWAEEPIAKHTRVLVVESTSARSVVVTPFN
jgi:membrane-bound ClpP family serine protease